MWTKAGRLFLLVAGTAIAVAFRRRRPAADAQAEQTPGSGQKTGGVADSDALATRVARIAARSVQPSSPGEAYTLNGADSATTSSDDGTAIMTADDAKPAASRAEPETDHPLVASRESSERLKGRRQAPPVNRIADPLEEKHKAGAFDRDFRTLDYSNLSDDEAARQRERQRRKREHSSWHPACEPEVRPAPAPVQQAQFATFGGSMVSAEVVRGRSDARVPDMMPTLAPSAEPAKAEKPKTIHAERRANFAFSHPDGPTPAKNQRRLPPDPLAEKHKAEKFDKDFRTLDYSSLNKAPEKPKSGPKIEPDGIIDKASLFADPDQIDEPAGTDPGPGAFRTAGAQATLTTIAHDGGASADGPPIAASAPQGLPGPRHGNPDDLTRIAGIGTAIEKLLFDRGLFHFDQIAALAPHEVVWLEQELGFPGRIAEERWIEQARRLIEG